MIIGLDANPTVTGHRFRGIGAYVKNLIQALFKCGAGLSLRLYITSGSLSAPGQAALHTVDKKEDLIRLAREDGIQALHITDYYHPVYKDVSDLNEIKRLGTKLVVTVADVIPLRFPQHYPAEEMFLRKNLAPLISLADRVITISRATADDLTGFFSLPPGRAAVTHLGADPEKFSPRPLDSDALVLKRYGINPPYFLYVGGFDWRKNCETILRAFSAFLRDARETYQLVFVGNDHPTPAMKEIIATIPGKPVTAGFIPESDLPPLYRQATALLFPSRNEGFGLPAVEAMACGTPVVCSDRGSLPEIVAGAGLLVDPDNLGGWVEAMRSLVSNPDLGENLRKKGLVRASSLTWTECARKTLEVYQGVV